MAKNIFTKSDKFKQEYCTTIVQIGDVLDIPGYDSIGVTYVQNISMVVRKDECKKGDILFYAANESELNETFLRRNNLYEIGERWAASQTRQGAEPLDPVSLRAVL